jgi:beta-glucanase (GH16 family)
MSPAQVRLSGNNTVTLTATPVTGQPPASHAGQSIPIHYLSGAIYANQNFAVAQAAGAGFDFSGEFIAPVAKGTWPAFWLTYVDGWPPEVDMAEWKGDGKISFNTFNTSSQVAALDVAYPNPGAWHAIKAELRAQGSDVVVKFYLDGKLVTTQVGSGYVGKAMYL